MPFTGQNIYRSAPVESRERAVNRIQEVRSGNWNRIPPERSPAERYMATKNAQREYIRSGQAFKGNARERQAELNQRSVSGFMERKRIFEQQ